MRLKVVKCNKVEMPKEVKVTMSVDEAAFLAKLTGDMNYIKAEEVLPRGGGKILEEIYNCLVGSLFNRYWDDGVREYVGDRKSK